MINCLITLILSLVYTKLSYFTLELHNIEIQNMKNLILTFAIVFLQSFLLAQSITNDTADITSDTNYVMTSQELTNAVINLDKDMRKAGALMELGAVASLSGTAISLLGTAISGNNHTGRLNGVVTTTTVISSLVGIAGIALTIAGAVKMKKVRITQQGVAVTF